MVIRVTLVDCWGANGPRWDRNVQLLTVRCSPGNGSIAKPPGPCYARKVNTHTLAASEITALLGRGTHFEGKLLFDGRLRIDGSFKGVIRSDDTLVIGDGAEVDAQVDVANVIIRGGVVRGAIRARSSIELYVPAHVTASLHAPSVFIDKGVHFEGTCKMADMDDPDAGGAQHTQTVLD